MSDCSTGHTYTPQPNPHLVQNQYDDRLRDAPKFESFDHLAAHLFTHEGDVKHVISCILRTVKLDTDCIIQGQFIERGWWLLELYDQGVRKWLGLAPSVFEAIFDIETTVSNPVDVSSAFLVRENAELRHVFDKQLEQLKRTEATNVTLQTELKRARDIQSNLAKEVEHYRPIVHSLIGLNKAMVAVL